jgi:malonyl-CoA O-methyltransferase
MNVSDAYSHWSATYDTDRNLTRDLDQAVTQRLLAGQRYPVILELGCGTGKNTRFLSQIGERLYAFDFSDGMIAQANVKVPDGSVQFAVADLTQPWPVADGCATLSVCNLVLEHISDLAAVFAEAYRVLGQGGRFFVCELHPFRQYQGKKARFVRDGQTIEIPAYVHHFSDFLTAATRTGFHLQRCDEWWHDEDDLTGPPRLASFLFQKLVVGAFGTGHLPPRSLAPSKL